MTARPRLRRPSPDAVHQPLVGAVAVPQRRPGCRGNLRGWLASLVMLMLGVASLTSTEARAQWDDEGGMDDEGDRLTLSVAWEHAQPVAGGVSRLAVVMDLQENWHVYPGKGSPDELEGYIATEVDLDLPAGWKAGDIQWPKAHDFNFMGMPIRVYEKRAVAFVPITIPATAEARNYSVGVTVRYQACDDQICEMPTSATADSSVSVLAAGATPEPATDALAKAVFGGGDGDDAAILELPAFDDGEAKRAAVRLAWEHPMQVAAGEKNPARLAVIVDIEETWHFWPYEQTGEESMFPTVFKVDLPSGWRLLEDKVRWPESHAVAVGTAGFQDEEMAYEGRVVTILPVVIPQNARAGEHPVKVTITYQACDPNVCEPPATVVAETKAKVVTDPQAMAGAKPTPPAIARLFADPKDKPAPGGATNPTAPPQQRDRSQADAGGGAAAGTDAGGGTPPSAGGSAGGVAAADAEHRGVKTEMEYMWLAFAILAAAMGWMFAQTLRITRNVGYRATVGVAAVAVVVFGFLMVRSMTTVPPVNWVKWSPEEFQEIRSSGSDDVVLVKFTADWCVNCKVIERTTLADPEVMETLNRPGVIAMKADLTGDYPEGWAAVRALGSGGIPLTAIYQRGDDEPIVFRSFYTKEAVLNAIAGGTGGAELAAFDFFGMRFNASGALVVVIAAVAGFFLNFTPCVLPVVPLKILSLQAHAKDPARCLFLGVVFGAGIIAFFLALGAVIAGLRGAFDWGQMFSYWPVNLGIGLVIAIMGLGMFNMFSIRLPQVAYMFNPQSDSAGGSFLMGVFTAILSTPCTGPLLGAAIAWVLTQSWILALLIFLAMGVGMAFPYVLLTAVPKWLDKLPRTGPGSELVKQVMGMLMIAVSVYFIGIAVTGMQGPNGGAGEAPSAQQQAPADDATQASTTVSASVLASIS